MPSGWRPRAAATAGIAGCAAWVGSGRPTASGWPLTITSAMKVRSLRGAVAARRNANSSGVSSMKRVVHAPAQEVRVRDQR